MNNPRAERQSQADIMQSPSAQDEAQFLAALPIIDDVTGQVCRRHRLTAAEAEEFRSEVRLHFIDRNYEALRRFEGRASLVTYITVVIQHLFLDNRNRAWGRWRPSTEARRLGPLGILLERLVVRDGYSCQQAFEMVRVNHGVHIDEAFRAFGEKLTGRGPTRRMVAEDEAREVASNGPGADANILRAEQDFLAKRVQSALDRARQALAPAERLILKMRFDDRIPIADIARALHLDQRRLYRTIERLLAGLRERLTAEGISKHDVDALLAEDTLSSLSSPAADGVNMQPPTDGRTSWSAGR
jgi:RNA polymerase sigma factor (sigma-70 family)